MLITTFAFEHHCLYCVWDTYRYIYRKDAILQEAFLPCFISDYIIYSTVLDFVYVKTRNFLFHPRPFLYSPARNEKKRYFSAYSTLYCNYFYVTKQHDEWQAKQSKANANTVCTQTQRHAITDEHKRCNVQ